MRGIFMRILGVSDLHGKCFKLVDYLKENRVNLIILSGDITHFGPVELAEEMLNEICCFQVPVLAVPGNCDPEGIHSKIECSGAINIHGKSLIIKNMGICGFGGSNRTPFNTPLEFDEIEIYEGIKRIIEEIKDQEVRILVTHSPPFGTKADLLPSGEHAGSKAIQNIIEEYQPDLNICGHIHEAKVIDKIGKTFIVNTGELANGYGCIVDIDEEDANLNIKPQIVRLSKI
jgi:uncharacterized protein